MQVALHATFCARTEKKDVKKNLLARFPLLSPLQKDKSLN